MKGVLVINKPKSYTSRDIVNKLNNIFHERKIGHTGTLDPIATGVLVICIGSYTKLVNELTSLEKEYIAEMQLGIKTDTGDITGNVLEKNSNTIDLETIKRVFQEFPKEYEQTVPKYSAIKINGKKLYEYARNNEIIDLPKRIVKIFNLELISYENSIIKFKTKVSKGTYIRSLIDDIATNLNTFATMKSLVRTKQGNFDISDSYTLEDLENNNYKLLDIEDIFNFPVIKVNTDNEKRFKNGNKVYLTISDGKYLIKDQEVFAIYEFKDGVGRIVIMI